MLTFGFPHAHRKILLRHTVAWAFLGVYLAGVSQQVGFLVGKLGGSPALVALAVTGPAVVSLLSFLYVPLGERFRSRSLVALSQLAAGVPFLLVALPMSAHALAILAFCAAGVSIAGHTFYGRLLAQLYPAESRGRLSSLPMFARSATGSAVGALVGWLLGGGSMAYRWVLPCAAVGGILGGLLVLGLPDIRPLRAERLRSIGRGVREVLRDTRYLLWTLLYSFINVGYWLSYSAKPVYYAKILGFTYFQNGLTVAAINVSYCIGLVFWGWVADRSGAVRTLALAWLIVGAGVALVVFAPTFGWVLVGEVLFGVGMAGNELARLLAVLEFAPADRIDGYMGLFMTLYGVRALSGGLIGIALMELSPSGSRAGLIIAAIVMVTGALVMFLFRAHPRNRQPSHR